MGLVTRSGLLPQHSSGARALAVRVLKEKNIVPWPWMNLELKMMAQRLSQPSLLRGPAVFSTKGRAKEVLVTGMCGNAAVSLGAWHASGCEQICGTCL